MVKNRTIYDYLEPFLDHKGELHLADISKRLKKPHVTVRQYLNELNKLKVLKKYYRGRQTIYYLNKESELMIDFLVCAEKGKLIRKSLSSMVIKEVVDFFRKNTDSPCIIFGSFTEKPIKAEDVDILIVKGENVDFTPLERKIGKRIHAVDVSDLEEVSSTLKEEIIKKHLIIQGESFFVKWLAWDGVKKEGEGLS